MSRRALLPLACFAALALTACSGGQPTARSVASADATSSASAAVSTPTTPGQVGSSRSPATTPNAASSGPNDPSASRAAAGLASPDPTAVGKTSSGAASGQQPAPAELGTAAGQYVYATKGTVTVGTPQPVDGTATLTVDPAAGGQQHSVLDGEQGRTEQDVVLRPGGRFLSNLSLTNPAFSKTFRPQPAALLLPSPAEVGRKWSWKTTSTDGKTTASTSNRVTRTQVLTIGAERVVCTVIDTTFVLSGDVSYRGLTTTWVSSRYRLPIKDHTRGSGTLSGVAFTTDITTTVRSTRPA